MSIPDILYLKCALRAWEIRAKHVQATSPSSPFWADTLRHSQSVPPPTPSHQAMTSPTTSYPKSWPPSCYCKACVSSQSRARRPSGRSGPWRWVELHLGRVADTQMFLDLILLLRAQVPPVGQKAPVFLLIDLLFCIIVDAPHNARMFEELEGLEAVTRVLRGSGVDKDTKCVNRALSEPNNVDRPQDEVLRVPLLLPPARRLCGRGGEPGAGAPLSVRVVKLRQRVPLARTAVVHLAPGCIAPAGPRWRP